jgi:hypothetical protein
MEENCPCRTGGAQPRFYALGATKMRSRGVSEIDSFSRTAHFSSATISHFVPNHHMKKLTIVFALTATLLANRALAQAPDFAKDIAPILEESCVKCHHAGKSKGKLNIETKEAALKGGENTKFIVAGKPEESGLIKTLLLPADHDEAMPPEGKAPRPDAAKIELLKKWITAGAAWPDDAKLKVPAEKK